jgi:hypothetical protein
MRVLAVLVLMVVCSAADPPAAPVAGELERTQALIERLTALKSRVAGLEQELDAVLRQLSEVKGALEKRPSFDAIRSPAEEVEPDHPKAAARCGALTSAGKRCTRPARTGSRYCSQHVLAYQK